MEVSRVLMSYFYLFFVVLLLTACQFWGGEPQPPKELVEVQVQRVIRGDLLEVLLPKQNQRIRVRLHGVIAPDLAQKPWGQAARDRLGDFFRSDKQAQFWPVNVNQGSPEGYLWHDRTLVNAALVKAGAVLVDDGDLEASTSTQYLQRLQQQARILGQGIWNPQQPMRLTPQEFRRHSPHK